VKLHRGSIVYVVLDPALGHEQAGIRPCVVVSDPEIVDDQRFPVVGVVPVTRSPAEGALYPALGPGGSGLKQVSYALTDQVRSIDKRRVRRVFGRVEPVELRRIDEGLLLFLGLAAEPESSDST
jgi:mRNA interferase MazF